MSNPSLPCNLLVVRLSYHPRRFGTQVSRTLFVASGPLQGWKRASAKHPVQASWGTGNVGLAVREYWLETSSHARPSAQYTSSGSLATVHKIRSSAGHRQMEIEGSLNVSKPQLAAS